VEWRQTADGPSPDFRCSVARAWQCRVVLSFLHSLEGAWFVHGGWGVGISYGILAPVLVAPVEGLFHSSFVIHAQLIARERNQSSKQSLVIDVRVDSYSVEGLVSSVTFRSSPLVEQRIRELP